jgi:hypothetical protein
MIEEGGSLKDRKGQKERKKTAEFIANQGGFDFWSVSAEPGRSDDGREKGSDRSHSIVSLFLSATAGLIVAGGVRFICENHILVEIAFESGDSVVLLLVITAFHGLSLPDQSIEYREFSATSLKSLLFFSLLRFSAQNTVRLSIPFIDFL